MANRSCILDPTVHMRALVRIGYFNDTKKQGRQVDYRRLLGWFVELSRMDLADMSPTELLLKREEVRALQEEGYGEVRLTEDDASTAQQVSRTQATVAQYLEQLTKTGKIGFEEFTLRTYILLPRFGPRPPTPFKHNIYIGEHVDPSDGKGLLYQFFLALKGAGDRLRPCPHCSTLFVQARTKQRFCTRVCQQVAFMRALRARPPIKKERAARKSSRRLTQGNRRASHGKKKR